MADKVDKNLFDEIKAYVSNPHIFTYTSFPSNRKAAEKFHISPSTVCQINQSKNFEEYKQRIRRIHIKTKYRDH